MTGTTLWTLLSHWRRNWLQFFTFLAGLALATALWSGVQAINSEARASYDAAAATLGEGRFAQARARSGEVFSQDAYITLRRAGWQVSPVLEGQFRAGEERVRLVGLDFLTAPASLAPEGGTLDASLLDVLTKGVLFANPDTEAMLGPATGLQVIANPNVAPGTALTDIGTAQRLLGKPGQLSRLIIADVQPLGLRPLEQVAPMLSVSPPQTGSDIGQLTDSFHLNLTAFGLLSFAVGIFIVHGTIGLAFEQRRPMIRTLRALGVPLGRLITLLALELALFALIAGTLGVALGYLIAAALLPDVAATLDGLYGAQVSGTLQFRLSWWLSGMAIALVGTAIAGTGALIQIARMPILSSARPRAWAMASGQRRRLIAVASMLLLVFAGALVFLPGGLVKGFTQLGALLLGAALTLPILLDQALRFASSRARRVIPQWFWADTRQQLPGLSLALMALLLAVAANIGVSTMVSSFRLTFVAFLDQRLSAELYVRAENPAQVPALEAFLKQNADEVLPLLSVDQPIAGVPGELYGVRVGRTYQENWAFLASSADAWDQVAEGNAVVVNEQLARRAGIWVGDTLTIGESPLPIAGIFGDYGNPIGQAVIAEDLFLSLHPSTIARQFAVRTADPEALREMLTNTFGLPEANLINQAAIKAVSLDVFERTFTVTEALNVLTLAVAAFAILMSLLTLATLRLPQLAPVWALGLSRRMLGRVELIRAVILALFTAVLALPVGLALAWVLLAVVNVEAFGWRLPMYLFPADYARLGLFALVAAALAAVWPALRLTRTPPNALLKVFASER